MPFFTTAWAYLLPQLLTAFGLAFVGYRHINLLSSAGDEIPGCTLFVHIITTPAVDKVSNMLVFTVFMYPVSILAAQLDMLVIVSSYYGCNNLAA